MSGEEGQLPSSFEAPGCEQLNELLPAFKFRELIACGGMGAVYRARQVSLGRDVAIKVLPPEVSAAGSVFEESFKTEARTMASLNHPNLVGIHDFGEVSGMLYLVMEYIDGNALYRSIRGQKVKAAQAVKIVEEVARGLGEAHERGLLHRDIKPANILLNQKRKPVLGDFGLVVRCDAVGSGLNMGTPGYIAPEVVSDFEAASPASDVYALGMILHEMLSGVMPSGKQAPDLTLVPELNGLRGLVGRLVSSDPSQRPADGEALAEELASWLEGAQRMKGLVLSPAATAARPAATVARPAQPTVLAPGTGRIPLGPAGAGRTASKSWWGPGGGALVVVVLAVVGIAMLQREEEPGPEQVEQDSQLAPAKPEPSIPRAVADERYYLALGLRKLSEGELRYQTAATFVERDSAMEQSARNNLPRAPSSSMAKVLASITPSPTGIPVPETEAIPGFNGFTDDIGQGWVVSKWVVRSTFHVVKGSFTWHEAKADAAKRGGRLAVLDTGEKIRRVNAALERLGTWPDLWIGLTDEKREGDWRWITGEALQSKGRNWARGNPSNSPHPGGDEDWGHIVGSAQNDYGAEPKLWNDKSQGHRESYLLELVKKESAR